MKTELDTMPEQQLSPQHTHSGGKGARAAASAIGAEMPNAASIPRLQATGNRWEEAVIHYFTCLTEPS